jgi:Ca2+-binding RTX toxin-like protein
MSRYQLGDRDMRAVRVNAGSSRRISGIDGFDALFAVFDGTGLNDTFLGTRRADVINGYGGNDTLAGGGADDRIDGGTGDDNLSGDAGNDVLIGGEGDDVISSNGGADAIDGGAGWDRWIGDFGDTSEAITFSASAGTLSGGTTFAGVERFGITTGSGDDVFQFSSAYLTDISAGTGYDSVSYRASDLRTQTGFVIERGIAQLSDKRIGYQGKDFISISGVESFALHNGRASDDIYLRNIEKAGEHVHIAVFGGGGADRISTKGNNIRVDGGAGDDAWIATLGGGVTYDQASQSLSNGSSAVNVEFVRLTSTSRGNSRPATYNISSAEQNLIVSADSGDQVNVDLGTSSTGLTFDGEGAFRFGRVYVESFIDSAPWLSIIAGSGDDIFDLTGGARVRVDTIDAGAGTDTLRLVLRQGNTFEVEESGTVRTASSVFSGFELFGLELQGKANVIATADGDDVITVVTTAVSNDDLSGAGGDDKISGGYGADLLKGEDGEDVLNGEAGDDTLNGGSGSDVLDGGAGSDTAGYVGATRGVTVTVADGRQDTRGAGIDTLVSIENLNGSAFNDVLTGSFSANVLQGFGGNDILQGLDGDDILVGAVGADRLTGGGGADLFAYVKLDHFQPGERDQILDFSHAEGDQIDVSGVDPSSQEQGDQAFTFIGGSTFSGADDRFELRATQRGEGTVLVQGDTNHDGAPDFAILVRTDAPFVAEDFLL